jgi:hypothetical protein
MRSTLGSLLSSLALPLANALVSLSLSFRSKSERAESLRLDLALLYKGERGRERKGERESGEGRERSPMRFRQKCCSSVISFCSFFARFALFAPKGKIKCPDSTVAFAALRWRRRRRRSTIVAAMLSLPSLLMPRRRS